MAGVSKRRKHIKKLAEKKEINASKQLELILMWKITMKFGKMMFIM